MAKTSVPLFPCTSQFLERNVGHLSFGGEALLCYLYTRRPTADVIRAPRGGGGAWLVDLPAVAEPLMSTLWAFGAAERLHIFTEVPRAHESMALEPRPKPPGPQGTGA